MKKTIFCALCTMGVLTVLMVSCNGASVSKAPLKSSVDSLSYAYGVNMTEQGLMQFLEQQGVIQSTSNIEYEYQMKISAADSTQKSAIQKEMNAKIDSVKRINAPRLNEFVKGLKEAIALEDKSPYASGLNIGLQFSQMMLPQINAMLSGAEPNTKINNDQLLAGMIANLKNQKQAISTAEAGPLVERELNKAQQAEQARKDEELKKQYSESISDEDKFMEENSMREGVVTLPSGLQYEIMRGGSGDVPVETDRVKVHYHGTLIDGTEFDSSVTRGEPATFGVNGVIPGWTEALKLMPVGSKWKLYVPYDLAYGSQDRGTIKPFSNLIFEVELIEIVK